MDKKKRTQYILSQTAIVVAALGPTYYLADQYAKSINHYESLKPKTFPVSITEAIEPIKELAPLPTYLVSEQIKLDKHQFECLAKNIFQEAGVEGYVGKLAVAQVTFARIGKRKSWSTVCKVVYAKNQFSWTIFAKKRNEVPKGKLWKESVKAAKDYLNGVRVRDLENVYYYLADYIEPPSWTNNLKQFKKIGTHVFYKYPDQ